MKILYISCHAILEYDEVKLFHEMGYDVFSAGVYAYPHFRAGMPRPGIDTLPHYPELERLASTIDASGGAIPQELIEWADTVIFMHRPEWLQKNWPKLKHKRVIFRSIGQCVSHTERLLEPMVVEGLQIVRYSPKERNIPSYSGENALIRFYKDPNEYTSWTGDKPQIINFTQSLTQRGEFCHKREIDMVTSGFQHTIYGIGNEDLGDRWGGQVEHEQMLQILRENRAYMYTGTWPASYTLSFMEALMTGIPIIATGTVTARGSFEPLDLYEIPDIINNGVNGFVSDDINQLREAADLLLNNHEYAKMISREGRKTAIELFGKNKIKDQWREFLSS